MDIKDNVIIIALTELVDNYSNSLESNKNNLSKEALETIQAVIDIANTILSEYQEKHNFKPTKPQWNQL